MTSSLVLIRRSLSILLLSCGWFALSGLFSATVAVAQDAHPPASNKAEKAEKDGGHPPAEADPKGAADAKVKDPPAPGKEGGHHDESHKPGEVKSLLEWKTDLALWTLITFLIFLGVLRAFAWGPLSAALDARESGIRNQIAQAEEARVKAEKLLAEYQSKLAAAQDEVLKTLAEARRDAEHTRQEIMAQTEKEVAATKERAILEIERTRDKALEELFQHMAGTVVNATERVLGRALTDADQDRLVSDALAEFSRGQAS